MEPMNSLRDVGFKDRYKRRQGHLMLEEFYIPMLKSSTTYDRVAGYFSSSVIKHASAGFAKFCDNPNTRGNEGLPKFRLIVGARLSSEDEQTVLHIQNPELASKISDSLVDTIDKISGDEEFDFDKRSRFSGLAWMLKKGLLEIKVGIRYDSVTKELIHHSEAEFHEKFGIASDGQNEVSFIGSVNETKRGWLENHESCDVFRSWQAGEQRRIDNHKGDFQEMWNTNGVNDEEGLAIFSFPEAAREKMLHHFPPADPRKFDEQSEIQMRRQYTGLGKNLSKKIQKTVSDDKKWAHQKDAIDWFLDETKANGRGILQMATGSGKTRTAIGIMRKANQEKLVEKTIICVPKTLENQWAKEVNLHYPENSLDCYWWASGNDQHLTFFSDNYKNSVLIVSYYFVPKLLDYARKYPHRMENTLLVVDELHHVGSEGYKKDMSSEHKNLDSEFDEERVDIKNYQLDDFAPFGMCLGLSATPWDEYDNTRNGYLISGFVNGNFTIEKDEDWKKQLIEEERVFHFGLKEGIEKRILCPFNYIPIPYTPSASDRQAAKDAFNKVNPNLPPRMKQIMGMILAAKVFKISREKLPPFKTWLMELMAAGNKLNRCILFVGDLSFGADVESLLSRDFEITDFRTFFQGESMKTLDQFALGRSESYPHGLDSLIACERISEGLDIKSVDTIILFCSDNARLKTIQRIGRALRTNEQNPEKIATVVDFIWEEEGSADVRRKEWLTELSKARGN